MKLTTRDKNALMIVFGFYILLFSILVFFSTTYFYKNIIEIENKKTVLAELYENKLEIEKEGIDYATFINLNKDNKKDIYFDNILANIDKAFYDDNFKNSGEGKFKNFINDKTKEINSPENVNKLLSDNEKISKILPSYLENNSLENGSTLTNFRFINYIESILSTFNLNSSDKIGITNIELLGEYEKLDGKNNTLEVNIFAFPLKLTLDGTKEGIVNFLHFAQNVGNIIVNEDEENPEENAFYINSDDLLKTKYGKITLKGDPNYREPSYNIYENQIFNIDYIKFGEYINIYGPGRKSSSFTEYIKSTQGKDEYSIDVKLYFYVKGIEQYELITYINSVIDKYFVLNKDVTNKLKGLNINKYDRVKYIQASSYLNEIKKEIQNLKKELLKKVNLEQLYNKVVKYNVSFTQIEKLLK